MGFALLRFICHGLQSLPLRRHTRELCLPFCSICGDQLGIGPHSTTDYVQFYTAQLFAPSDISVVARLVMRTAGSLNMALDRHSITAKIRLPPNECGGPCSWKDLDMCRYSWRPGGGRQRLCRVAGVNRNSVHCLLNVVRNIPNFVARTMRVSDRFACVIGCPEIAFFVSTELL